MPPPPPPPGASWGAPPPQGGWSGLPPQAGAPEYAPQPTDWERRGELGLVRGFFGTMQKSMFSPDPFWRSVRPDGSLWDAVSFAWINMGVYFLLAMPLAALQWKSSLMGRPSQSPEVDEMMRWVVENLTVSVMFGVGIALALAAPVTLLINAAITHVALLILGGAKGGFTATVRAMGYGTGPWIAGWVPCLGVVSIYALVLQLWGQTRLHRTDVWRPIVAFLLPLLVLCCCLFGVAVIAGVSAAGSAASP